MKRLVPPLLDLLVVVVFAVVGRASHAEGLDATGIWSTAWPFLAACVVAQLVLALMRDDGWSWRAAAIVWLVTLLGGMALRLATGGSAATAFVIVAALFLGACCFGWRLLARLTRRRS